MTDVAKAPKVVKEPVKISIAGVLADLDNGLDRAGIKAKYGISHADMALLFKNPALKGRKPKGTVRTKKAPGFVLIEDVDGTATQAAPETGLADAALAEAPAQETVAEQATAPAAEALDKW